MIVPYSYHAHLWEWQYQPWLPTRYIIRVSYHYDPLWLITVDIDHLSIIHHYPRGWSFLCVSYNYQPSTSSRIKVGYCELWSPMVNHYLLLHVSSTWSFMMINHNDPGHHYQPWLWYFSCHYHPIWPYGWHFINHLLTIDMNHPSISRHSWRISIQSSSPQASPSSSLWGQHHAGAWFRQGRWWVGRHISHGGALQVSQGVGNHQVCAPFQGMIDPLRGKAASFWG